MWRQKIPTSELATIAYLICKATLDPPPEQRIKEVVLRDGRRSISNSTLTSPLLQIERIPDCGELANGPGRYTLKVDGHFHRKPEVSGRADGRSCRRTDASGRGKKKRTLQTKHSRRTKHGTKTSVKKRFRSRSGHENLVHLIY